MNQGGERQVTDDDVGDLVSHAGTNDLDGDKEGAEKVERITHSGVQRLVIAEVLTLCPTGCALLIYLKHKPQFRLYNATPTNAEY